MVALLMWALLQAGVAGRWDLTAKTDSSTYPMWIEILAGPPAAGRLQNKYGHALPLTDVVIEGNRVRFPMPSEEPVTDPARVALVIEGETLSGEIVDPKGPRVRITGVRAPSLTRSGVPQWGAPINLLDGGLAGWRPEDPKGRNNWGIANEELVNTAKGTNLITRTVYTDFKLHIEVNVPTSGNSGIYLRGRHEVQVQDDFGKPPGNRNMGGIYGQITPALLPARQAGEWQSFDITLIGRRVTVVLNGTTIIDNAEIPGTTGGALDSAEGEPGPIMLQGDHTAIRYRNIRIVPAR